VRSILFLAALASTSPGRTAGDLWVDLTRHSQSAVETENGGDLRRAPDGLFYVTGVVNGVPVRFLVDTGASTTVLTRADALRTGLLPDGAMFLQTADTANGRTPMAWVNIDELQVGSMRTRELPAAVASDGLSVSLLGQSWVARLESMTIAGDRMTFRY